MASPILLLAFCAAAAIAQQPDAPKSAVSEAARLEAGFAAPPASAYPRVYWWWLQSNVTPESITRDLEAMKRQGIGGAILMDAGVGDATVARRTAAGPRFLSPQWRAMFRHAVAEADRLGLELSLNLGSGWNCGGPWITPQFAAQKIVWSETAVEGPLRFSAKLPIASVVEKDDAGRPIFYRDVAVLAVKPPPLPKLKQRPILPKIVARSSQQKYPIELAADRYLKTHWRSKGTRPGEGPTAAFPEWIQFEFQEPFAIRSFYIAPVPGHGPQQCELQWTEDGKEYQTLHKFVMSPDKPLTLTFPRFKSRIYRLVIDTSYDSDSPKKPRNVQIREIAILADGETCDVIPLPDPIKHWELKSVNKLLGPEDRLDFNAYFEQAPTVLGDVQVDSRLTVDLSGATGPDGSLTWEAPEGEWTILRFGHTITGRQVSTPSPGGEGLVLDPLSRAALDIHLEKMAEPLIREIDNAGGKGLKYLHAESWQIGPVNWTPDFPTEFKRRRGCDLSRYLPVLARKIVDSRELSNRFLNDFRRTIGDCIAENHYGRMRDFAHRHKLALMAESGGPQPAPIDAVECLAKNDVPMGEFRAPSKTGRDDDVRQFYVKAAASVAHVYGRNLVAAEGFTAIGPPWERTPRDLKPFADRAFCAG
ncbi:MAG: glycosyl hydrolase, partial [Planctomycetota bacterium]